MVGNEGVVLRCEYIGTGAPPLAEADMWRCSGRVLPIDEREGEATRLEVPNRRGAGKGGDSDAPCSW